MNENFQAARLRRALIGGIVGGVIGCLLLIYVIVNVIVNPWLFALAVGFTTGLGVRMAGYGRDRIIGVLSAVITLVAVMTGLIIGMDGYVHQTWGTFLTSHVTVGDVINSVITSARPADWIFLVIALFVGYAVPNAFKATPQSTTDSKAPAMK